MEDFDVVVAGAGPAGLTAAYVACKEGLRPLVLERSRFMGGIARTVNYRGYRFDIGGHRFFTKVERVRRLWAEILGEAFLWRPRMSRIYYNEKFLSYPLRPLDAFIKLGPIESLSCVASLAKAKLRPLEDESHFDAWVINRFGRRLFDVFFRSYTEKVWGVPCDQIKAEWAAQRIKSLSLAGAILNAFVKSGDHTSLIERFQYPRLGPGQMWEACRDRIVAMGGTILTGMEVVDLNHRAGQVESLTARDEKGSLHVYRARHFVSSMAIRDLFDCLSPAAPAGPHEAAHRLRYRDFIVVSLIIKQAEIFPDNWIYIHSPAVRVGRIQNFKNWSADLVPDPDHTCLGLEYFCFKQDDLWAAADKDLIQLATRELETIGLLRSRDDVVDGCVVRMEKTYPMYVGETFSEDLATTRDFLLTLKNLHCCGRNGQHRYNNQDHSMYTACLAVENMLGARHDIWNVNVERVYHEVIRPDDAGGESSGR
ncbi:MAG: NAD(P)/FAD-dependent oxidoreductase [Acidobacteriota bacterium]